ncbi:hypothetical protein EJ04DRAFT_513632 [Polyplosphaeria fusca]|uniref:Uncharacterized protein n=1 Tax=Polyplosphaeria fusca TaxID=682080 RepID=A0A9P4V236_9PLEO|nr:hypothetical protein EJ04DRAFT_513632 [Polyplosphaeria fusca]
MTDIGLAYFLRAAREDSSVAHFESLLCLLISANSSKDIKSSTCLGVVSHLRSSLVGSLANIALGGFDAGGGAEWKPDTAASEPLKAEDTGGGGDAWGGAGVGAEAAGSAFGGAAFGGDNAADDGDSTCRL